MPSNSYFTSLFFFSGHCFRTLISHVQMEIDQWDWWYFIMLSKLDFYSKVLKGRIFCFLTPADIPLSLIFAWCICSVWIYVCINVTWRCVFEVWQTGFHSQWTQSAKGSRWNQTPIQHKKYIICTFHNE